MTEQELRALVRDAIARHAGLPGSAGAQPSSAGVLMRHPSHGLFMVPAGADMEGPCLIEPTVMCNHCGYCQSYGH